MTGFWVVFGALAAVLVFGFYRKCTDGKIREVSQTDKMLLSPAELSSPLGAKATYVQFSSPACAPCRATARVLGDFSRDNDGVIHVEIDASARLDLAKKCGITRTPTVLVLDTFGVTTQKLVGAVRKGEVEDTLRRMDEVSPAH